MLLWVVMFVITLINRDRKTILSIPLIVGIGIFFNVFSLFNQLL